MCHVSCTKLVDVSDMALLIAFVALGDQTSRQHIPLPVRSGHKSEATDHANV